MSDTTHVVVLQGTGRDMVPVPEMAAFAERYGFGFQAHEKGDANRSAHVERRFSYIENNFLAGRSFQDWDDANRQARAWCDQVNAQYRNKLKASPRELFAAERKCTRLLSSHTEISYPGLNQKAKTDRKSTRLNSSHTVNSYDVFCLKKKKRYYT